ncbi:HTH_Tnp_Tc3_2 domain-containing protein [Trichonephila clavipes]|nr:HTH_Tnp_Tc3_2 domain-containing protein [Trichonephila clavipes]
MLYFQRPAQPSIYMPSASVQRALLLPYSDEDIRLRESDCEDFEKYADEIDNTPVNPDIYVARYGTERYRIITYRPPPRSERYGSCSVLATVDQKECTVADPRNTNDREDRAIRRLATSAPTTSLFASIQRHLPPSRHPVPSRETIRRRLTEVGLRSRRPLRRLPLTPHHRQCRLDFCRPRATWSVTDWRRVIFSDESRFSLSDDDHRTRVWRRTGQRSDPAFIVERHTAISQGVTVWGKFLGTHDHL